MHPSSQSVRTAGLLYLIIIVCGISAEVALRGPLMSDSAAQTMANILAHPVQFKAAFLADLIMTMADVALAVILYRVLRIVSEPVAMIALVFRLVQAAILATNLMNLHLAGQFAALGQADLTATYMHAMAAGYDLGLVFFAINAMATGWLICHGKAAPRPIAAGMMVSGLIYLTGSTLRIAAPHLSDGFEIAYLIPFLAESALCLWLLIFAKRLSANIRPA